MEQFKVKVLIKNPTKKVFEKIKIKFLKKKVFSFYFLKKKKKKKTRVSL